MIINLRLYSVYHAEAKKGQMHSFFNHYMNAENYTDLPVPRFPRPAPGGGGGGGAGQAGVLAAAGGDVTAAAVALPFTALDRAMVVTGAVLLALGFTAVVCLAKTKRHWHLDGRPALSGLILYASLYTGSII